MAPLLLFFYLAVPGSSAVAYSAAVMGQHYQPLKGEEQEGGEEEEGDSCDRRTSSRGDGNGSKTESDATRSQVSMSPDD